MGAVLLHQLAQLGAISIPGVELAAAGSMRYVEPEVVITGDVRDPVRDIRERDQGAFDALVLVGDVAGHDDDVGLLPVNLGGELHHDVAVLGEVGVDVRDARDPH